MTWPFTLCLHLHLTLHLQWQLLLQLPLQSRIHLYFYLRLHLDYIHTLDDLIFTFRQAVLLVFMESREELKSKGLPSVFMPRADRTKTLNMPSVAQWCGDIFSVKFRSPNCKSSPWLWRGIRFCRSAVRCADLLGTSGTQLPQQHGTRRNCEIGLYLFL
jgi:hypothetical protein